MNGQMSARIREIWKREKLRDLIVVFTQEGFLMMIITITIILITTSNWIKQSVGSGKHTNTFNSVPVLEGY